MFGKSRNTKGSIKKLGEKFRKIQSPIKRFLSYKKD